MTSAQESGWGPLLARGRCLCDVHQLGLVICCVARCRVASCRCVEHDWDGSVCLCAASVQVGLLMQERDLLLREKASLQVGG
jgi:hypothetical protein